ncbi:MULTISPECIES: ATP-binding protein [unclassified Lysinibacillus]|uniref:sensor histidine kinase n=1 Tax=unclassified Lysinibacillus TaxID=2636778 RepID=UPI0020128F66|nr:MULTISPECIES: ATP-binding protein [unclassified Lysinibacillus]MCL1695967.1 histidine kinase [Lysinibacillus sp. BPa_S21]MCL1700679.1 histidine kinase [Lysinibacillus sp. Bpr_S20]
MVLKSLKNNWFWLAISTYLILGSYLLYVTYSTPFLAIKLKEENGQWLISEPYFKKWANDQGISPGDIVLEIDGKNINKINNIKYDPVIRVAKELTLVKQDKKLLHIHIDPFNIPEQLLYLLIVPASFYLLSLIISILLYYKQKNSSLINILILFILTVSLAYVSMGASGMLDSVGTVVNRSSMILCLVLLIHFLRNYFLFLNLNWLLIYNIKIIYVVPLIIAVLSYCSIIYPYMNPIFSNFTLWLFFILLIIIFGVLGIGYLKYKTPQLKMFLLSIIIPFLPFLFLFAVPEIIFQVHILTGEVCSLFLMLIPYSFICTQLTERIFDMEYFITRLRHYFNFSFVFTIWLLMGLYWLTDLSISRMTEIFFFTFLSLIALFYIKEKIDYHKRKILYSTKGDYIHRLYTTVDSIGRVVKIEDLLEKFVQEIALHLEIKQVSVLTYDLQTHHVTSTNTSKEYTQNQINEILLEKLRLGDIKKTEHFYIAFIHQDINFKRILVVDHNKSIYLKDEELLWLELLLLYVNNFIENTKMVEDLLEQLKHMKEADKNQLPWLNKLLWLRFEQEKYQLAQELHDTVLQEQLHIAREMDVFMHAKTKDIQANLSKIHDHMIASLNDLRGYCENLKPPLLDTLGLNAALEKLIHKVHKRADFVLIYTIDRLYLEDERLNLMIYRLFQELLNNALKHSHANTVEIHLLETEDGFEIIYADDGVGCKMDEIILADSMGIRGMQDRVQAFNGQFTINTNVGEGMSIRIKVNEGDHTSIPMDTILVLEG